MLLAYHACICTGRPSWRCSTLRWHPCAFATAPCQCLLAALHSHLGRCSPSAPTAMHHWPTLGVLMRSIVPSALRPVQPAYYFYIFSSSILVNDSLVSLNPKDLCFLQALDDPSVRRIQHSEGKQRLLYMYVEAQSGGRAASPSLHTITIAFW